MMQFRLVHERDVEGWHAAVSGLPHCISHTHGFARLMAQAQGAQALLFVAENADGRAVCPISERSFHGERDVYSPYGFGGFVTRGDVTGLRNAWKAFAVERGYVASYLMQNPILLSDEVAQQWGLECHQSRDVYVINLSVPESARLQLVSSRKRAELKRWLETARIEYNQEILAHAFVALYPGFAQRRTMPPLYQFAPDVLTRLVSLPETCLVGVRGEGGAVSCVALLGMSEACGDYLFMASAPDAETDGAGTLWLGLRAMAEKGIPVCNLGGGIRDGDGVAEMKRRLGGEVQKVVTLREVFDPIKYAALCEAAGVDPDHSNFFPAYYKQA